MSKRAGRHSQASNDHIAPYKPVISSTTIATNRPYNDGKVEVYFTMSEGSPFVSLYTVKTVVPEGQTPLTGTGTTSPVAITGLLSATNYKFTITASNDSGNGPASEESVEVYVTTNPETPATPSLTNNGAEQNSITWTAPNTGGLTITGYELLDDEGRTWSHGPDVRSANVNDGGNSYQQVKVRATNSSGTSAYSSFSNQIQTTPFSFSPFGFTPFGFTPFGFTPFGFTPFGFTPKSVGAETVIKSKVPEGLVLAHNLSVGDVLYSANIEGIDVSNTAIVEYLQNWSSSSAQIAPAETTIVAMAARISDDGAVVINANKYSAEHFILVKREGQIQFQGAKDVLETDLIYSPSENDWIAITDYLITDQKELLVSIDVEPYDLFFTDNALVHDSYPAFKNPNALTSSDEAFSDKLDIMYQQWRDSQDQEQQ
jgi:hypothetical protein